MKGRLPKSKRSIAEALRLHGERETSRMGMRRVMWAVAYYYLNGVRQFRALNPAAGYVTPALLDADGNLEFVMTELLTAIDRSSATIASMDLRPSVLRPGLSLPLIRQRASAQALADSLVNPSSMSKAQRLWAHTFTTLGSCGTMIHVSNTARGVVGDVEIVHPREIMPWPGVGMDLNRQQGIMRQNTITLDDLVDLVGTSVKRRLPEMEWWDVLPGESMDDTADGLAGGSTVRAFSGGSPTTKQSTLEGQAIIRMRQLWLDGPDDTCARYVAASGNELLIDDDYSDLETYCPLGFSRFADNGSFHGVGLFDMLFSISREAERAMKQLLTNLRDTDRFGVTLIPHGTVSHRSVSRDKGKPLSFVTYAPEAFADNVRPINIQPFNLGEIPGKTVQFTREIARDINPIRDLLQEKGRVDSASGLMFLDEQAGRAMTNPTLGTSSAWGTAWRAATAKAASMIRLSRSEIPIVHLTMDLAGLRINPERSTMSFLTNPIPNVGRLSFGVKDTSPRSETALKREALELLQMQVTDPMSLKLWSIKEGVDFAMWMEEERNAYEQCVRNCLSLYGDGEFPGQIIITPSTILPEIQQRIVKLFMSGPYLAIASPEVIDHFTDYSMFLAQQLGMSIPEGVPTPDDAAMLTPDQPNTPPTQDRGQAVGGPFPIRQFA